MIIKQLLNNDSNKKFSIFKTYHTHIGKKEQYQHINLLAYLWGDVEF